MTSARWFLLAKIFAWMGLLSLVAIAAGLFLGAPDINFIARTTIVMASLTLVTAMIGAASTIILGWRSDRRQSEEFKLKIQQLELELAEAKAAMQQPNSN
jgi:hypothetical protein